jgi:hypothetical protein
MGEKAKTKKRFCGNCVHHNPYDYPDQILCTKLLLENKNPVVQTLWCCEEWNATGEECYCVEEAMKKDNK